MLQNIRKNQKGFTIIEVLIVLAIAGLILLIVFLAVPALQRNSRNTQIRNSAAAVLGGINDFVSNNNGQLPTTIGPAAANGTVPITGPAGTTAAEARVQAGFTVGNGAAMPGGTGAIVIYLNRKCNGNAFAAAATNRAYAAGFLVETTGGGGTAPQCVES